MKATNGDHKLGGKDWDDALIQYVGDKFEQMHGINPFSDEADYQALKEKALSAKISLTQLPETTIAYGCKGKLIREKITREKFEEISRRLVEQCRMLIDLVLREGRYQRTDIDVVILAGGSTRMPMIVSMLYGLFWQGNRTSPSIRINA